MVSFIEAIYSVHLYTDAPHVSAVCLCWAGCGDTSGCEMCSPHPQSAHSLLGAGRDPSVISESDATLFSDRVKPVGESPSVKGQYLSHINMLLWKSCALKCIYTWLNFLIIQVGSP